MVKLRFSILALLVVLGCANRGNPTGGEIDTEPPVVLKSSPENFTTNFEAKEVEIIFNEYIRLNNIQKELIISPPIEPQPLIMPMGSASKILTISEFDSLRKNTTYSFHFGESIEDNNEKNTLSNYRYVFSTGDYIDSLIVKGNVIDAFNREISENINVHLYEVDSLFNDSIIFKEKPKHVGKVIDSTNKFLIQNIKEGKYLIIALEEENKDYTFQSKVDKIGFIEDYIELPKDSVINLKIFKEKLKLRIGKPKQKTNRSFTFGYEGNYEPFSIKIINTDSIKYSSRITREKKSDSLTYWIKTDQKLDSIIFNVFNDKFSDTLLVNLRNKENDSLIIKSGQNKTLKFNENFIIEANLPFEKIDKNKIIILDKDSLNIDFKVKLDSIKNQYNFIFEKDEEQEYGIRLLPGALTDFYENENDSLFYKIKTRTYNDYGNLRLNLINAKFPIIVELVNANGETKYETYETYNSTIDFSNIDSGKYYIRIIFDENKNQKYDTGNFLFRAYPEKVIYYPDEIDVRAGWDLIQEFILK
tara:strand:+ start:706 stop:2298 length:1593 start_codon:yes stop_codon:yes gene_type:complete